MEGMITKLEAKILDCTQAEIVKATKPLETPKSLEVKYKEKIINATMSDMYLGVKVDSTMTIQEHFIFYIQKGIILIDSVVKAEIPPNR